MFSLQFVDLKSDLQAPVIRKTKLSHLQWSSVSLDAMEQREIAMESKDTKKRSHAAIVSSDNAPKKKMASNIVVNPKISHLLMKKYILPDYKYILAPMVRPQYERALTYSPNHGQELRHRSLYRSDPVTCTPSHLYPIYLNLLDLTILSVVIGWWIGATFSTALPAIWSDVGLHSDDELEQVRI